MSIRPTFYAKFAKRFVAVLSRIVTFVDGMKNTKSFSIPFILSQLFNASIKSILAAILLVLLANCSMKGSSKQKIADAINGSTDKLRVNLDVTELNVSEGSAALINVILTDRRTESTVVAISLTSSRNDVSSDFMPVAESVTIPAGALSASLTLTTRQDTLFEKDEKFTLGISSSDSQVIVDQPEIVVTILDDDVAPKVSVDSTAQNINESSGTGEIAISLDHASAFSSVVSYTVTSSTASSSDYTMASGDVTFAPGETSKTLSFSVLQDSDVESAETFSVSLASSSANVTVGSNSTHTVTIVDDDFTSLTVSDATAVEGSNLSFTVTLSVASSGTVQFDWSTAAGTAAAGVNFTSASGTETVLSGTLTKTITVASLDSAGICETDKSFTVSISNPVNATISDASGTGTITDNDLPSLSIANASNTEGSPVGITATLSVACPTKNVTFEWSNASGTATSGTDFSAISSQLATITAGSTTTTLSTSTTADGLDEADETFSVSLANLSNATGGTTTATATIVDNDSAPTVNFTASTSSLSEAGSAVSITAQLSTASGQAVSIPYTVTGTATGSGTDYSISSSPLSIPAGSTSASITVTPVDDSNVEGDETIVVTMGTVVNATKGSTDVHTITLTSDDWPVVNFSGATSSVSESTGLSEAWHSGMTSWTRRKKIFINNKDATEDISAVPLMVKLDSTRVDYSQTQNAGEDLRFLDQSGNSLNYEVESWNESGTSFVWVESPTLTTGSTSQYIWMYYGNTSASDGQNLAGTWSGTSFQGVYHFASGAGNVTNDSSGNSNNLSLVNGLNVTTTGEMGMGPVVSFDGTDDYATASGTSISAISGSMMAEMWVYHQCPFGCYYAGAGNNTSGWRVTQQVTGYSKMLVSNSAGIGYDGSMNGDGVEKNEWVHYLFYFNDSTDELSVYRNGEFSSKVTTSRYPDPSAIAFEIGRTPGTSSGYFTGKIDEVRVASAVQSASWIRADYLSQVDQFLGFGAEESNLGDAVLTLTLDQSSPYSATIPYTIFGTASGSDTNATNGSVVIAAGQTSATVRFNIYKDTADAEGNETIIATLGTPTNATLGTTTQHTVTIVDDPNFAPVANNDSTTLTSVGAAYIYPLANDTDVNSDYLLISAVSTPTKGTVRNMNTYLIYTPNSDFASEVLTYTVSDSRGGTANGSITLGYSIPFTWTGNVSNAWNVAGNWLGGSVPTSTDAVYFTSDCVNCDPSLVATTSVGSLVMTSSFTGSINMNTYTLNVGANGAKTAYYNQFGGTLNGGSGAFNLYDGLLNLAGGTFNASSGSNNFDFAPYINSNLTMLDLTGGTFVSNSGTVYLTGNGNRNLKLGTNSFGNLYFDNASYYLAGSDSPSVNGTLTLKGSTGSIPLNGGEIKTYGSIDVIDGGRGGTTLVRLLGSSSQTVTTTGTGSYNPRFPSIELNNSAGVTFVQSSTNPIRFAGDFTYTAGAVTFPTDIQFGDNYYTSSTQNISMASSLSVNNLSTYPLNRAVSGTLVLAGDLTLTNTVCSGHSYQSLGGTFEIQGSLYIYGCGVRGSTLFSFTGSDSNITIVSSDPSYSRVPAIEFAKTAGQTLTLTAASPSVLIFTDNVTYTSGNLATNNITVHFDTASFAHVGSTGKTYSLGGSIQFQDVKVYMNSSPLYPSISGSLNVLGKLTLSSGISTQINGGEINAYGDVQLGLTTTGTTVLNMLGGSNATLSTVGTVWSDMIPGSVFTINKPGATVTFANSVETRSADWDVVAGDLDLAGRNLTIGAGTSTTINLNGNTLTKNGGVLTIGGSTQGTGSILGGTVNP